MEDWGRLETRLLREVLEEMRLREAYLERLGFWRDGEEERPVAMLKERAKGLLERE